MLSLSQAQAIAESEFRREVDLEDNQLVILPESTIERPFGWVFFYNSRRFVETGELSSQFAGNAPLIVNRYTGAVVNTGTAYPPEHYISAYEASLTSKNT
jgi:Immunity protein 35